MYLDVARFFNIHPMGETATHPIVLFFGRGAVFLLLA